MSFLKIFIAGPRAISKLDQNVEKRLHNIRINGFTVLVGDANGVDRAVQGFFHKLRYENLYVFAAGKKARNNIGHWQVVDVHVPNEITGFDFYARKDLKMAEDADYGFMIWNGESKGTLNNIINLLSKQKRVLVYFTPHRRFYSLNKTNDLTSLLSRCPKLTKELACKLLQNHQPPSFLFSNRCGGGGPLPLP